MKILAGQSNKGLAQKLGNILSVNLSPVEFHEFADGEERVRIEEPVVGEDVVIVQTTAGKVNDYYMELFFLVDAARRSGAKSITAVIPYLGYQRQDHVFRGGEAVSLDVVINVLEAVGADKIITFDLHSIKIPELFNIKVSHLSALPLFASEIKTMVNGPAEGETRQGRQLSIVNCSLVSPDMGGIRRIKILSDALDMPYVTIEKNRDLNTGKIEAAKLNGEMKRNAIILDDMISTGQTIVSAVSLLRKKGAEKIWVFATHPVFSKAAPEILEKANIERVYTTDTIEVPKEKMFPKLEIISVADIIAEELKKI